MSTSTSTGQKNPSDPDNNQSIPDNRADNSYDSSEDNPFYGYSEEQVLQKYREFIRVLRPSLVDEQTFKRCILQIIEGFYIIWLYGRPILKEGPEYKLLKNLFPLLGASPLDPPPTRTVVLSILKEHDETGLWNPGESMEGINDLPQTSTIPSSQSAAAIVHSDRLPPPMKIGPPSSKPKTSRSPSNRETERGSAHLQHAGPVPEEIQHTKRRLIIKGPIEKDTNNSGVSGTVETSTSINVAPAGENRTSQPQRHFRVNDGTLSPAVLKQMQQQGVQFIDKTTEGNKSPEAAPDGNGGKGKEAQHPGHQGGGKRKREVSRNRIVSAKYVTDDEYTTGAEAEDEDEDADEDKEEVPATKPPLSEHESSLVGETEYAPSIPAEEEDEEEEEERPKPKKRRKRYPEPQLAFEPDSYYTHDSDSNDPKVTTLKTLLGEVVKAATPCNRCISYSNLCWVYTNADRERKKRKVVCRSCARHKQACSTSASRRLNPRRAQSTSANPPAPKWRRTTRAPSQAPSRARSQAPSRAASRPTSRAPSRVASRGASRATSRAPDERQSEFSDSPEQSNKAMIQELKQRIGSLEQSVATKIGGVQGQVNRLTSDLQTANEFLAVSHKATGKRLDSLETNQEGFKDCFNNLNSTLKNFTQHVFQGYEMWDRNKNLKDVNPAALSLDLPPLQASTSHSGGPSFTPRRARTTSSGSSNSNGVRTRANHLFDNFIDPEFFDVTIKMDFSDEENDQVLRRRFSESNVHPAGMEIDTWGEKGICDTAEAKEHGNDRDSQDGTMPLRDHLEEGEDIARDVGNNETAGSSVLGSLPPAGNAENPARNPDSGGNDSEHQGTSGRSELGSVARAEGGDVELRKDSGSQQPEDPGTAAEIAVSHQPSSEHRIEDIRDDGGGNGADVTMQDVEDKHSITEPLKSPVLAAENRTGLENQDMGSACSQFQNMDLSLEEQEELDADPDAEGEEELANVADPMPLTPAQNIGNAATASIGQDNTSMDVDADPHPVPSEDSVQLPPTEVSSGAKIDSGDCGNASGEDIPESAGGKEEMLEAIGTTDIPSNDTIAAETSSQSTSVNPGTHLQELPSPQDIQMSDIRTSQDEDSDSPPNTGATQASSKAPKLPALNTLIPYSSASPSPDSGPQSSPLSTLEESSLPSTPMPPPAAIQKEPKAGQPVAALKRQLPVRSTRNKTPSRG